MQAKINGVCRGDGKIYMRIFVTGLAQDDTLSICASSADGKNIPCNIYEALESSSTKSQRVFIAVFPVLTVRGHSFSIHPQSNKEEKLSFPLSFSRAKWESRFNYKVNRPLCDKIRGYDKISTFNNANFEYWECLQDSDASILRGLVTLPYESDSSITVTCFDNALESIAISPIILSDTKAPSPVKDDVLLREMQLSIRLPNTVDSCIFVIEDATHPEFNSFNALEAHRHRGLIWETNQTMLNAQIDPNYPAWFENHKADIDVLAKQSTISFAINPTFSIVVPLYKTPINFFNEMVLSVQNQSYKRWELILVNASPEDAALSEAIVNAVASDKRISAVPLRENLGISENTNAGIKAAKGDYICFFDHDDLLEPNLLFEYAKAINEHDNVDLLYCDEDKLMPDGKLAQPFFKPDFNLDLLRNNNYICHLLCIRKSLLDSLPNNTKEFDGAQDHNLTLRAVEKARNIHHVAKVLYHWRLSETSTAANAESKPYATQAGIKAVQSHLDRMGLSATVSQSRRPFTYRVRYNTPQEHPLVSIIIPTKDHTEVLDTCISSVIEKTTYDNYEIILVENNSIEAETFSYYERLKKKWPDKITVATWPAEFNFSKLMNFGIEHARGDYLLLLNNDTEVITPSWIEELLGVCARPDVGVVGCRLYYRDDTIQHAGVCVTGGVAGHLGKNLPRGQWGYFALADAEQDLSAVTAACMMTKRSVFTSVNGFTEELSVAFNDIDYCLKVREKGLLVVYTPEAELYHYESLSRGYETSLAKKVRFHREISYMNYRWAEYYVMGDPYININITRNEPFNCYYHL